MDKKGKLKGEQGNKGDTNMENTIEREKRPCTVAESLKQSLKEMNLIREGKMPKRNLDDFLDQLEKEIHNEE
jgi:hypothetical protein